MSFSNVGTDVTRTFTRVYIFQGHLIWPMFLTGRPSKDEKPEINQSLLTNEQFLKKVSTSNLLGTPNFNILFTYHGHLCHSSIHHQRRVVNTSAFIQMESASGF